MMLVQSDRLEFVCNEILNLDPKIRFVGIINDKGKLLAENKRDGIEKLIDSKDKEILLMEIALGVRMRREHDEYLGPVNFTVTYGEKIASMNFPFDKSIVCVSAEKNIDVLKMAFLILHLLEEKPSQNESTY